MKYLCKSCGTMCHAKSFNDIMVNKKLCDKHLQEQNANSLRRLFPVKKKKILKNPVWLCLTCGTTSNAVRKPMQCTGCLGNSLKNTRC